VGLGLNKRHKNYIKTVSVTAYWGHRIHLKDNNAATSAHQLTGWTSKSDRCWHSIANTICPLWGKVSEIFYKYVSTCVDLQLTRRRRDLTKINGIWTSHQTRPITITSIIYSSPTLSCQTTRGRKMLQSYIMTKER